jgi:AcrR family transcriptional regulator
VHDTDGILDVAERLAGERGPAAVTIRAVAELSGASSGSIYHAFASREALVATVWLRAARRFLALQRDAIDEALAGDGGRDGGRDGDGGGHRGDRAVAATLAAATALVRLRRAHPGSAELLFAQRREALLGSGQLPEALADALAALDDELLDALRTLARALWDRADRAAVETVAVCVVDLPTALLVERRPRTIDTAGLLDAAVRAVLAEPLPARGTQPRASTRVG